ncbi:telomerase reverse transcriptase-like isoform X2 [Homalodisca vitripennis]|uniref:telomerase reverse transcriptase-like isoform X2 n=1 Tax=Homalodisca vitripennis TaxID=197043 RepID=UPI001EEBC9E0|nr:telomerase reverse transcriptase-like isoform X2 [Homalodisca vitripennis]
MRMSSFVPFIPHQPLVLREDLLYKSVSYKWKLGMKAGVTSSDIINDILHEDVGSKLPVQLTSQQLSSLKLSLDKLLAKKFAVKKRLTELVMKTTVDHKSGMAVSAMIFAPLKILIPSDLVGGSKNKIKLLHVIQRTLKFGRMDIIPLKFLMEGLTVKGWLKTVRETKIREHVLAKVVKWIWIVTKRLVASLFYVTEGQGCHHKLLYFPKKSWQSRTDSAFNYLVTSGTLQPLDKVEAERLAALRKPASLRWLPKKIGLRPVVSVKNDKTDNDVIHAKAYLRGLLIKTGYSDLNEKTLHQIWKSVVLKNCEDGYKKLYMVAVDIHDAYGSMRQDKLLEIVKETSELYMGEDYMNRTVHMDKVHWLRPPICRELHSSSYDTSPHKTTIRKVSDLMCTVQKAVQYQTIKREKRAYLVTKGLSQAVPLSAVLCKLYIAHLDRTRLTELRTKSCDTMVRAVDDYLFITPDNSRASRFLEVMSSGFPEYGLYINPTKTQHNLETCSEIHFFGYVIDSVSLEIYVKFNQGEKAPYRNSFKFSNWTNPLMVMEDKLKRIVTFKLNSLTTDLDYMSVEGSMWNVFQTACLAACSFKAMLGSWRTSLDLEALVGLIRYSAENIAKRIRRLRFSDEIYLNTSVC